MAAIGFTPIQLFRTTTASATPSAPTLADGELAINLTDEKLYFKNAAGVVKLLAANLNAVANGGTGATSLSANGVLIGNGTSAVTTVTGTTGRVLTGNTGGAPSFEPIGNVAVSSISFGTTGLTPSTATLGAVTVGGTLNVANGGTGVTTSTGTGSTVRNTSPTLVTPTLGAASATSIANGLGAVGTPSYTFTGDTNTGMWSPAADTLAFSTAGSERVRVTSAGIVGIGTSSPAELLHISGATAEFQGTNTTNLDVTAGTAQVFKFGVEGQRNNVYGPAGSIIFRQDGSTWSATSANFKPTRLEFCTQDSTADDTSETPRLVITSSGNVGIGTTSPNATISTFGGFATLEAASFNRGALGSGIRVTLSSAFYSVLATDKPLNLGTTTSQAVLFSPNNTERMRIDSSGNVGIGTSSPSQLLEVAGAGSPTLQVTSTNSITPGIRLNRAGAQGWGMQIVNTNPDFAIRRLNSDGSVSINAFYITTSGNVGIGTTSPSDLLHLARDNVLAIRLQRTGDTPSNAVVENSSNRLVLKSDGSGISFDTGGTPAERMRLDSNGNLLVGKTANDDSTVGTRIAAVGQLSVVRNNQSAAIFDRLTADGSLILFRRENVEVGSISVTTTTTSYNITSDRRLKHDIVNAPDAADLIDAIKVRSFKWNADDSEQRYGMIAQELLEVAPEAVSAPENPDEMMSVDYSKLVPMLIKEIQSLRTRVAQLEGK